MYIPNCVHYNNRQIFHIRVLLNSEFTSAAELLCKNERLWSVSQNNQHRKGLSIRVCCSLHYILCCSVCCSLYYLLCCPACCSLYGLHCCCSGCVAFTYNVPTNLGQMMIPRRTLSNSLWNKESTTQSSVLLDKKLQHSYVMPSFHLSWSDRNSATACCQEQQVEDLH